MTQITTTGVITHLEPDILEYEVKWALGTSLQTKLVDVIEFQLTIQILKDDFVKVLQSICQQIWKNQQWPQNGKGSVLIPIPKRAMIKNVQFSSVTQSCPTLRPHESQHARPPCPSPTPGVHSDSRLSSQ